MGVVSRMQISEFLQAGPADDSNHADGMILPEHVFRGIWGRI